MDARQIEAAFDDAFDQALLFHGFVEYMRDYEMIMQLSADPSTGIPTDFVRYIFVHCVRADVSTALTPEIWRDSLDERLIDYDTGADLDGYVWGVKWQLLYPGLALISNSTAAEQWSDALGVPFHEARVQTNGHDMTLIFSDLRVEKIFTGYSPFTLGAPFWDGKIPL